MYGCGNIAQLTLAKISQDFQIDYVIDKVAATKDTWEGIPLKPLVDGLAERGNRKIIVMTGGRVYREICKSLQDAGLVETRDFCSVEYFLTYWYGDYREETVLADLHMALTMQCTLKCKHCNMFVPYYQRAVTLPLQQAEEELRLLMSQVDYLACLTLLGGEPFLYKDLDVLLDFLHAEYATRIGTINLITNGTLLPDTRLLKAMQSVNACISISDYTQKVAYGKRLIELQRLLDDYGIRYTVASMKDWRAFGFPENPADIPDAELTAHRLSCSPSCHGYNDGKIFYCHMVWSAAQIGKYQLHAQDCIDLHLLKSEDRHKIAEHCLGELEPAYTGMCKICGGMGPDNMHVVPAGEQMPSA